MKKAIILILILFCAVFVVRDMAQAAEKTSGNFTYKVLSKKKKTAAITFVKKAGKKLVIPKKIKGYKVVQVGRNNKKYYSEKDGAKLYFANMNEKIYNDSVIPATEKQKLKQVIFPDTVTIIGGAAFSDCVKLKKVKLPAKLKYINVRAFLNTAVYSVKLPKTMKGVGIEAFANCLKLKKLIVKSPSVVIGEYAFDINAYPRESKNEPYEGMLKKIELPSPFEGKLNTNCFSGYAGRIFTWPNFQGKKISRYFLGTAENLTTIKFDKNTKKIFIAEETLPFGQIKKLVIPASVKKITLEQQTITLDSLTIKGKKTVLEGDIAMGMSKYRYKRKYISARKIIAPKNSKAWKYAKKAYYPNIFLHNFDAIVDKVGGELPECEYREDYIQMQKVIRKAL